MWVWIRSTVGQGRIVEAATSSAISRKHVGAHFIDTIGPSCIGLEFRKHSCSYLSTALVSMMFWVSHNLKFVFVFSSRPGGLIPRSSLKKVRNYFFGPFAGKFLF